MTNTPKRATPVQLGIIDALLDATDFSASEVMAEFPDGKCPTCGHPTERCLDQLTFSEAEAAIALLNAKPRIRRQSDAR